eukprot:CAMPEP_0195617204 /NCGR_PEP_ID=MMETSP0815-20121206/13427_1 /TAXON_ID=97485 /ORGANISM="Prymnesium parvum, Strain Texoma1" /LENGTH=348 /DNA_ID=CAMNT_0040757663 /DNA_START=410 /DNA_END=1454 /DNA_ORIENTATION=+
MQSWPKNRCLLMGTIPRRLLGRPAAQGMKAARRNQARVGCQVAARSPPLDCISTRAHPPDGGRTGREATSWGLEIKREARERDAAGRFIQDAALARGRGGAAFFGVRRRGGELALREARVARRRACLDEERAAPRGGAVGRAADGEVGAADVGGGVGEVRDAAEADDRRLADGRRQRRVEAERAEALPAVVADGERAAEERAAQVAHVEKHRAVGQLRERRLVHRAEALVDRPPARAAVVGERDEVLRVRAAVARHEDPPRVLAAPQLQRGAGAGQCARRAAPRGGEVARRRPRGAAVGARHHRVAQRVLALAEAAQHVHQRDAPADAVVHRRGVGGAARQPAASARG